MATVNASAVQSLRARTGVSISECKKALDEAGGDEEKAIEILKKRGMAQAAKKAARDQFEGKVFLASDKGKAVLVLLKCETDFVARNPEFVQFGQEFADLLLAKGDAAVKAEAEKKLPAIVQKLGENIGLGALESVEAPVIGTYVHTNQKIGVIIGMTGGSQDIARDVAMHAAAMGPIHRSPDQVQQEAVDKEKEIWKEQLKKEGKPEAIWDKIMMGKEKKFREEVSLLTQPFVKDPSKTVKQYVGDGEVVAYVRLAVS